MCSINESLQQFQEVSTVIKDIVTDKEIEAWES